jgi:hypothetical protein
MDELSIMCIDGAALVSGILDYAAEVIFIAL